MRQLQEVDMAIYELELIKAVETKYRHSDNEVISQREVTSGVLTAGYIGTTNYYYSVELYFNAPDSSIINKKWSSPSLKNVSGILNQEMHSITGYKPINRETSYELESLVSVQGVINYTISSLPHFYATTGGNDLSLALIDDSRVDSSGQYFGNQIRVLIRRPVIPASYQDFYGTQFEISENSVLRIACTDITYNISPVYPLNVNVKSSSRFNITWNLTQSTPRESLYPVRSSVEVEQNGEIKTFEQPSGDNYVSIPENTFTVGTAKYKIHVFDSYGQENISEEALFDVTGASSAPTIINVTQDSFPTIEWTSPNQIAWQLMIKQGDNVIYDSGTVTGSNQSFKLDKMLSNGPYAVLVKALNSYGYYSDWGSYGVELNPSAPEAPTSILTSVTDDFGVAIDCEAPQGTGTLYVVRRKPNEEAVEVIGEYSNGFVDYSIPLNTTYEYTVRNYISGYADGEWLDATVNAPGIVIRDPSNIKKFINLWKIKDGEFNVTEYDQRQSSLVKCVGRVYPVKELSEWIVSSRSINAFVPCEDYSRLKDMAIDCKFVYLQSSTEYIPCDMELNEDDIYLNSGKFVNITFTRIDGE